MTILTPPWAQNAGTVYTAQMMRYYTNVGLLGDTSMLPRGGVNYSMGGACAVTEDSPQSMNVRVLSGTGAVSGTENALQGAYPFMNDGTVIVALTASHATLNRIDLIIVRVRDTAFSGGLNNATIEVVTGTPASSPAPPAAPANSLILAQVLVGAAVTVVTNSNITGRRWPLSGVLEARKAADETVNNSATLQNDDQLFLDVNIPNSNWAIEAFIRYNSPATPDIKFAWNGPSGGSVRWIDAFARNVAVGFGTTLSMTTTGIEEGFYMTGILSVASTIGRVNLQWAQNTANASNTIVRSFAWIRFRLMS